MIRGILVTVALRGHLGPFMLYILREPSSSSRVESRQLQPNDRLGCPDQNNAALGAQRWFPEVLEDEPARMCP